MSSYFIPFNFCPESIVKRTGSFSAYTVPAGYYARIVANVKGDGYITIDSSIILNAAVNTVLSTSNLRTTLVSGERALLTNGTSASPGDAFSSVDNYATVTADYWVPTGTTVAGTVSNGTVGVVISLYPMIS